MSKKEKNEDLREWSEDLIQFTKDAFLDQDFGFTPEKTVRLKRNDGSYGYIELWDALNSRYNVHNDKRGNVYEYNNVSEMIKDGWVLD